MKKLVLAGLIVLFSVLVIGIGLAQTGYDETTMRNKALQCLFNQVNSSASLTLQQAVFSALAGVPYNDEKINRTISSSKLASKSCWPEQAGSSVCNLKTTSQVLLAKQKLGQNTDDIANWISNQTGPIEGLTWYLQITINDNSPDSCTINYDDSSYQVSIDENMKLSGEPGPCLTFADQNYRMKIENRDSGNGKCVEKEFWVKCSKSFKTNLLYRQESSSGVLYVSPDTQEQIGGADWTRHQITAKCFVQEGKCDYEGSLWASTALYASRKNTDAFVPYLQALAPSNKQYFPSAFIHYVIRGANQYEEIMSQRRTDVPGVYYWELANSPYTKYYDTSLAMLAVGGRDSDVIKDKVFQFFYRYQDNSGCWGGLVENAFIIYSAKWSSYWQDFFAGMSTLCESSGVNGLCKSSCGVGETQLTAVCSDAAKVCCSGSPSTPPNPPAGSSCVSSVVNGTCRSTCLSNETSVSANCTTSTDSCCVYYRPGTGAIPTQCSLAGYFCTDDEEGCGSANGVIKPSQLFYCETFAELCCTVQVGAAPLPSCYNLNGDICAADEICPAGADLLQSSDAGECCSSPCQKTSGGGTPQPACTVDSNCAEGEACVNGACQAKGGSSWFWIIILIILIILVLLGIIFRDKIRVWWFKLRGKAKTSRIGPLGMPSGAGFPGPRPPPRFIPQRRPMPIGTARPAFAQPRAAPQVARTTKDKEMDETLRKLREMSQ